MYYVYFFFLSDCISTDYVYFVPYLIAPPDGLCIFCHLSYFLSTDYVYFVFLSDSHPMNYVYCFSYLNSYPRMMCIFLLSYFISTDHV